MIKQINKSNRFTSPFVAVKAWNLFNVQNEDVVLLEPQSASVIIPDTEISVDYIDYSGTPSLNTDCNIALEQQVDDQVIFQEGVSGSGLFIPDLEEQNVDGTYKRLVYTQTGRAFYNLYRNPLQIFGMENIDFPRSQTLRYLANRFVLFTIPQNIMGDEMLPGTVQMYDNSLDDNVNLHDDGNGNLHAGFDLFSKIQEVRHFGNLVVSGSISSNCPSYTPPTGSAPPSPPTSSVPIILIVTSGSAILNWTSGSTQNITSYTIQKSLDGNAYSHLYDVQTVSGSGDIVTNGGFEAGNFNGWTMVDITNSSTVTTNYVHSGTYGAYLGPWNGNTGSLSQVLTTGVGNTFELSLWLKSDTGNDLFKVYWEGVEIADLTGISAPYTQYTYPVTSSGTTSTLEFRMRNEADWFGLDDVSVTYSPPLIYVPRTHTDTIVNGGNTYWYKVAAINNNETSSYSNTASITFVTASTPPSGPILLSVISGSAILDWVYVDTNQDGFNVEKSTDGVAYSNLVTLPTPSIRTYTDTAVSAGNTYWYRVNAYNNIGTSSYSNIVDITFAAPSFCGATPSDIQNTTWTMAGGLVPPCSDFVWNSGSASWYFKRGWHDQVCSSWMDAQTTICNPGASYPITVTIPWDSTGTVLGSPPYNVGFTLEIGGVLQDNQVGNMASPATIVMVGTIPATTANIIVRLYIASGGVSGGLPDGYTVTSTTDLTITPLTHP